MVLTLKQRNRLFEALDPLTVYANERLGVVDPGVLTWRNRGRLDADAQAKVLFKLWENRQVIDDYMSECAFDLQGWQFDALLDWRRMRKALYTVVELPEGGLAFLSNGYLFEVTGISKEIADMLHELPAHVEAVLLPFDGIITYAEALMELAIGVGDGLAAMISGEVQETLQQRGVVRDAKGLIEASKQIEADELDAGMQGLHAEIAALEDPDSAALGPSEGCHRGPLAGLSYDERQAPIDKYLQRDGDCFDTSASAMRSACTSGKPRAGLAELLALEKKQVLSEYCAAYGIEGAHKLKKVELAERLARFMVEDENYLPIRLAALRSNDLRHLKRLFGEGGRLRVEPALFTSFDDVFERLFGLCYLFRVGDEVECVMPDEVVAVLDDELLDESIAISESHEHVIRVAGALVELRGLVPLDDVLAEYERLYPDDPFSHYAEGETAIMEALARRIAPFRVFEAVSDEDAYVDDDYEPQVGDEVEVDVQEVYLLHFDLARQCLDQEGELYDVLEDGRILVGPVGEFLQGLLNAQSHWSARGIDDDMLESFMLLTWKMRQPCTEALRRFLDENVPDDEDDYRFADDVVQAVLDEAKWGSVGADMLRRYLDILERNGFAPDEAHAQPMLDALMGVANGLPVWPNNGWAPADLIGKKPR